MRRATESPPPWARDAWVVAAVALATLCLGVVTTRAMLGRCDGPAVPLDDAYIHLQYARSLAELHPFRYTLGAAPTPGATSLLWPALLAPFVAAGLSGAQAIWASWALGFAGLALTALETRRLAEGLMHPALAVGAGALVLSFGGFTWFAASGMEVMPFAWLLARSFRRAAEEAEGESPPVAELWLLAALTPLMRPEGAVASLALAAALLLGPDGSVARAVPALLGPLLPPLVGLLATGQAVPSTALAKWLPLNPYYRGEGLARAIAGNVELFFGTLLDGRLWTSVFLPSGGRVVGALALVALPVAGVRRGRARRGLLVTALALTILAPASYETFLVNRVRYVWPFATAWLVGLAALCDLAGGVVMLAVTRLGRLRADTAERWPVPQLLAVSAAAALLATKLPASVADVAESARAVTRQQVSLAEWARDTLPPEALIGVNDTGAIAWFSGRSTFDVVGLTTAGEARYWSAGPGARFEHYERLGAARLPTHFIVYPEWFAVDALLGERLASRTYRHTILGGATMSAHVADYALLSSGASPRDVTARGELLDALDVADVDDELSHGYALLDADSTRCQVVAGYDRADGARLSRYRDEFRLRLAPGGQLVVRLGASEHVRVLVQAGLATLGEVDIEPTGWHEAVLPVPSTLTAGEHPVVVQVAADATRARFASLHYWSYE